MKVKVYFKNNVSDNLILLRNRIRSILSFMNYRKDESEYFYIDTKSKEIYMENNELYPEHYDDIIGNFYNLITEKGTYYNGKLIGNRYE